MAKSCDTFVVLPTLTQSGVVFGKNSDRPSDEVQEILYVPESKHEAGGKVKCTYIEIDQVEKTLGVILSKPTWMWGAEMGANSSGVVIGNEAVYTKVGVDGPDALLGMDLVRLALERAESAADAVDVIVSLLERHGQGGACYESGTTRYHNSFLIADPTSAWVVETAGKLWVAQKVENFKNISNTLTIGTNIDKMSADVKQYAIDNKLWDGQGDFDWAKTFSDGGCDRLEKGESLLKSFTSEKKFQVPDMFKILRDSESGICMKMGSSCVTASSQVSLLFGDRPSAHWFTGTPDPSMSVFKPFVFTPSVKISQHTVAPSGEKSHNLYKLHSIAVESKPKVLEQLREMEETCTEETISFLTSYDSTSQLSELDELFKDVVETEVKFYK